MHILMKKNIFYHSRNQEERTGCQDDEACAMIRFRGPGAEVSLTGLGETH